MDGDMNLKPIDFIVTAKHYSPDGTPRGYLLKMRDEIQRHRGVRLNVSESVAGSPLPARIERGQWIADCECGGATFVDPEWPFTFCFNCRANGDNLRPVKFPDEWREIEKMMLDRPQNDMAGLTDLERAALARPILHVQGKGGLARNWVPGETLADLKDQQDEPIKAWRKDLKRKK